jgi:hypothetical protein
MRIITPEVYLLGTLGEFLCAPRDDRCELSSCRRETSDAVVTVLSSSWGSNGFEGLVENDEKFSHDGSQGEFVRFTFGAQTLIKRREDMVATSRGQRCHVKAAAQSAAAAEDGALAT